MVNRRGRSSGRRWVVMSRRGGCGLARLRCWLRCWLRLVLGGRRVVVMAGLIASSECCRGEPQSSRAEGDGCEGSEDGTSHSVHVGSVYCVTTQRVQKITKLTTGASWE